VSLEVAKFLFHAGGVAAVGVIREVPGSDDAKCSEVSHGLRLGLPKQEGTAPQLIRARAVFVLRFERTIGATIGLQVIPGFPFLRVWSARRVDRSDVCTIE
jgi:hypothetical protein